MPTLLSKTSLPTWVLILIIAVGSVCILITAGLVIRCKVIRRRAKRNSSVIEQGPMRKMTVRRGRMVPASNYLSLTGSRFGLNQFDETDNTKSGRKSPMQWWNTVKERRQGGSQDMERGDIYNRRSFVQSTSSLTEEKQASTTTQQIEPAFPSPTGGPPSPAFPSPKAQRSPDRSSYTRPLQPRASAFMHARNLSMIEEASSPHHSVISSRSNPRKSNMSLTPSVEQLPRHDQRRLSPGPSSPSFPLRPSPNQSSSDLPRHMAYAGSRTNVSEITGPPRSSLSNSQGSSRQDSATDISISRPMAQHPPQHPSSQPNNTFDSMLQSQAQYQPQQQPRNQSNEYQQRIHRTASTKGTVLRKKSLRQHQVYSAVAT